MLFGEQSSDHPERDQMVRRQLRARNIRDERVLAAMLNVPRELFVPESEAGQAYADCALPIGCGQTISQPYIVALTLEALQLRGHERVLEVGAGSGYQAALLGLLAREVYAIEIVPELAESAKRVIEELGYDNVRVIMGDGSIGYPPAAPYDAIAVAAAPRTLPPALVDQLVDGGRLVIPVGERWGQTLYRIRKRGRHTDAEALTGCAFVPLITDS